MTSDRSPEAERLLMRIRASADPAASVQQRVLASVERHVARDRELAQRGDASSGSTPLSRLAAHGRQITQLAARWGRWGAFGLVAGAIGYHLGATERGGAVADGVAISVSAPTPSVAPEEAATAAPDATPLPAAPLVVPEQAQLARPLESPPIAASSTPAAPSRAAAAAAPLASSPSRRVSRPSPRSPAIERNEPQATSTTGARRVSLAELIERLLRAQASLRDSDPHATIEQLDALDALDGTSPGELRDERLVLRAIALCDLGHIGDARRVLSELDRLGLESLYRGRLEQSCRAALGP